MNISVKDTLAYIGPPGLSNLPPKTPEALRLITLDVTVNKLEKFIDNIRVVLAFLAFLLLTLKEYSRLMKIQQL